MDASLLRTAEDYQLTELRSQRADSIELHRSHLRAVRNQAEHLRHRIAKGADAWETSALANQEATVRELEAKVKDLRADVVAVIAEQERRAAI